MLLAFAYSHLWCLQKLMMEFKSRKRDVRTLRTTWGEQEVARAYAVVEGKRMQSESILTAADGVHHALGQDQVPDAGCKRRCDQGHDDDA